METRGYWKMFADLEEEKLESVAALLELRPESNQTISVLFHKQLRINNVPEDAYWLQTSSACNSLTLDGSEQTGKHLVIAS